jgi:hypothetical protein
MVRRGRVLLSVPPRAGEFEARDRLLTDIWDGDGGVIVDGDEVAGNDRTT